MKIVIIGGTSVIASRLAVKLAEQGHEILQASPASGVNVLTGQGLAEALEGASVVVDVSNPVSYAGAAAIGFFQTAALNLLAEETAADVDHHVALSVVGANRLPESGYFRDRISQEELIKLSSRPFTIVHATQLFESIGVITEAAVIDGEVRLAPALIQPLAVEDLVDTLAEITLGPPHNATVEIAGPELFHLEEFVRHGLIISDDPRVVVPDPQALFFGAHLHERTLLPNPQALQGETRFQDWLGSAIPAGARHTDPV